MSVRSLWVFCLFFFKFFSILTDFLSIETVISVDYWEKNIDIFNYNCESVSPFISVNFCLMYFEALQMGTYLKAVMSSW